jgi:hypothetical protein
LIRVDIRDERHHIYGETITWGSGTTRFEAIGVLVGKVATVPNPPIPVLPPLTPANTPTGFDLAITDIANINYPIGIPITPLSWQAFGGTPPYAFDVSAGSLPTGLALSSSGILTGTPTTEGSYSFTVRVTDDDADTATDGILVGVTAVPATIPVFGDLPRLAVLFGYLPQMRDPGAIFIAESMDVLLGYIPTMNTPEILTELRAMIGYTPDLDLDLIVGIPRYEAEFGIINTGSTEIRSNASGELTVAGIESGSDPLTALILQVDFPTEGEYLITIGYSSVDTSNWLVAVQLADPRSEFFSLTNTGDYDTFDSLSAEFTVFVGSAETGIIDCWVYPDTIDDEGIAEIDYIDVEFVS